MTGQATARDTCAERRAYLLGGFRELTCDRCGVVVLVKKTSPPHTSVQWSAESVRGCAEFAAQAAAGEPTALIATCARLRASIERAVVEGRLQISVEDP